MTGWLRVRLSRSAAARHVHVTLGVPEALREAWCGAVRSHDPYDAGDEVRCARCSKTWRKGA